MISINYKLKSYYTLYKSTELAFKKKGGMFTDFSDRNLFQIIQSRPSYATKERKGSVPSILRKYIHENNQSGNTSSQRKSIKFSDQNSPLKRKIRIVPFNKKLVPMKKNKESIKQLNDVLRTTHLFRLQNYFIEKGYPFYEDNYKVLISEHK
jgi:hypothetical protein